MDFPHLTLTRDIDPLDYGGRGYANPPQVERSIENRRAHAEFLINSFSQTPTTYPEAYISEEQGIYIQLISEAGFQLKLDSLHGRDHQLCNVTDANDVQKALLFIPETKRRNFSQKLERYRSQEERRNHKTLFDNVAQITLASISDFWTSSPDHYPSESDTSVWWEIWLRRTSENRQEIEDLKAYCKMHELQISSISSSFELYSVLCVQATVSQLAESVTLVACLSELRKPVDTAHFLLDMPAQEQAEWVDDILERTDQEPDSTVRVLILDSGINYNHPLLSQSISATTSFTWDDQWGDFDPACHHGTWQAGTTLYGDLFEAAASAEPIYIPYSLESFRFFNHADNNSYLAGAITYFGIVTAEKSDENKKRVISLAITTEEFDDLSGQPTSWSSEIDQISYDGSESRLFICATGNVAIEDNEYRESVIANPIENPAQAWNALTVGSYTTKIDINDPTFKHWQPLAKAGDSCPTARSSINWEWKKNAPLKPDIVEEGGNWLFNGDADNPEVTNADCVSLVTTSDINNGDLFTDTRDSSAATALCSRIAAHVWSAYPNYSAQTIRALITHSANWTPAMQEYIERFQENGVPNVESRTKVLQIFGHGVPDEEKAINCSQQKATLVLEDNIAPFILRDGKFKFNSMHLIELPWDKEYFLDQGDTPVQLRITLSYFIEPNPGRRAYSSKFSYQSYGLRFALQHRDEERDDLVQRINAGQRQPDFEPIADADRNSWDFGPQIRSRGCLHQDTWHGQLSDLASREHLAIYPVSGWWMQRRSMLFEKKDDAIPYSMVLTLETPDETVDLYHTIENVIETEIEIDLPTA